MRFLNKTGFFLLLPVLFGLAGCSTSMTRHAPIAEPASDKPLRETPASQPRPIPLQQSNPVVLAQKSSTGQATTLLYCPLPAAADDLWQRIRLGFRLNTPEKPRVEREISWYASHPDYLERIEERALPYLYFIVEQVEQRGLPMELALLPVVESAFQPFAYSPGRAAGIWQFIPSTGRMYGLRQNWWYDGRRDIVAATHAALDFLQTLAARFDGDWELALAAYNSGAGTVRKAIRKNEKRGKPTDFWSLRLPRETQGYVPRLLAISQVIKDPAKYGLSLSPIPNRPYFGTVDIDAQLDLALAAEMAEVSMKELYRLNPGFNRWATDPKGPHRLNLPLDQIDVFERKLVQLDPSSRMQWERYKIRSGDNLGAIAHRYGTTVAVLQQANRLQGSRIRAGRHLLIPVSTRRLDHYALSSDQRRAKLQATPRNGNKLTHRVRSGDTLWDIARSYRVGYKELARWNGISPKDTLRPDQKLVLWSPKGSAGGAPPTVDANPFTQTRSSVHYRVRKGDSLYRIANRFNVTVAELRKWNTLSGRYLQPGQRLTLYLDVREQTL